ncbi:hypothetical protein AYO20_03216 [Fonsecaea nubica]|uniref:Major facilitator superfamily (MFS) profile domain-containing protein n=1 Tax=Fonsecaea nubica TaxID=856822 RepID=A0A178D6S8_9EURO|nr:hypothetical protein AYO20_03216 [Fonsecaea nubica]OAL37367.1 hypothetical protein AYO20_03216 [Fonsecaea nubica]
MTTQAEVIHEEEKERESEKHDAAIISPENEIEAYENRALDLRSILGIVALAFTYEACILSFIVPAVILLTINADIGPSTQIAWVAQAWTVGGAVTQTVAGRCSDIFGRRNFFIAGNLLGLVGTIVASRADKVNQVIAGTALMGVAGGIQQIAYAAANEIVPRKHRGSAIAFMNVFALPGSAFGSVIAYAIVADLNWRWTFYIGAIANGWAFLLITIFYWPPGFVGLHPGKTRFQQFKELDFLGLVLFGGGLTCFLLGISWGGNPYPWTSAQVLAPLILGALTLIVAFPLWEIYSPDNLAKLFPPGVMKNVRGFTLPLVAILISGMSLQSLQILWPQQVQYLFTQVPRTIGWYSLGFNLAATIGIVVSGTMFGVVKRTNWQFFVTTLLQTAFIGAMASVNQNTPAQAIVLVAFASFWVSAAQVIGVLLVQFGVEDKDIGAATGIRGSTLAFGGAIAVGIYSSIMNNKVADELAPRVAEAAVGAGLNPDNLESFIVALTTGSTAALGAIPNITPAIINTGAEAIKSVHSDAFRLVYLVSIAFGGIAIIAAAFVKNVDHKLTQ